MYLERLSPNCSSKTDKNIPPRKSNETLGSTNLKNGTTPSSVNLEKVPFLEVDYQYQTETGTELYILLINEKNECKKNQPLLFSNNHIAALLLPAVANHHHQLTKQIHLQPWTLHLENSLVFPSFTIL